MAVEAPAKINLALHVTGRRPQDGYHTLDSLIAFAGIADRMEASPADDLSITVTGPFAEGVPADHRNIVLRAAETLRAARRLDRGARISLEKNLPHAAGLGSGSSDAAAALSLLAALWQTDPLNPQSPDVVALGADVPACMMAPAPMRAAGIGDALFSVPTLPGAALVLVNPRVEVPTAEVYAALRQKENAPMEPLPEAPDLDTFTAWLSRQRNDLQAPAIGIAPIIDECLHKLRRLPQVRFAAMSGSGATCFGIVRDMGDARQAARAIQIAEQGWWVAPAELLQATRATT